MMPPTPGSLDLEFALQCYFLTLGLFDHQFFVKIR